MSQSLFSNPIYSCLTPVDFSDVADGQFSERVKQYKDELEIIEAVKYGQSMGERSMRIIR
jgi:hypothetical protein